MLREHIQERILMQNTKIDSNPMYFLLFISKKDKLFLQLQIQIDFI